MLLLGALVLLAGGAARGLGRRLASDELLFLRGLSNHQQESIKGEHRLQVDEAEALVFDLP